jgi:hypothetical protein
MSGPTLVRKTNSYPIAFANSGAVDAFARLRVSTPYTIFDSKQIFDDQSLFWDDAETAGSGTSSSYSANTSSTTISVGTAAGTRVRQTLRRFNYQPGKSQLVFMTMQLDASGGGTGIRRRVGMFDDQNGIFVEDDEGTIKFVRRTYVTGSAVDNKETLPTTYSDGTTIDWGKVQIIWFDLEWLGVGRVRMGVVRNGTPEILHEEDAVNTLTEVYMTTPNLPLRYEVDNPDGNGAASSLECICSTVISEGGLQETGVVRYASTAGTHVTLGSVEDTLYPVIGIRLGSSYLDSTVQVLGVNLFIQTASEKVEWVLLWGGGANPLSIGGTFTYSAQTESTVEFAALTGGTPSISGGVQIAGGHAISQSPAAGGAGVASANLDTSLLLGSKIDGTRDEVVLAARGINGSVSAEVEAGITWRELL